jgi:mono/diheme cytochrome c family protein
MKRLVPVIFVLASAVAWLSAQDAAQIATGRALFLEKKCNLCHQAEGKGNKMYSLHGVAAKMSEADVRRWLTAPAEMEAKLETQPKLKMSSKKVALTPAQVDALVAYIKSLQ